MSTFTQRKGQTTCDSCATPTAATWQAKRLHLDKHAPAIYHATRSAEQEDKT